MLRYIMALLEMLSQNLTTVCVFWLTFIVLLSVISLKTKSRYILPNGPKTLPFFGNALSIKANDEMLKQLVKFGKEYVLTYSIYIGRKLIVVVNGWDGIKEVAVKGDLDFADRPRYVPKAESINPHRLGIFDTLAGDGWKNQRKFAHTTLRGMGFGKVSLEPLIQREANEAVKCFKQRQGSLINPNTVLAVSSFNVISNLVYDHRINHGSEAGDELMDNVQKLIFLDGGFLTRVFPFTWHVLKYTKRWRDLFKAWQNVVAFFHREVAKRQAMIDNSIGDPEIRTFIDAYLVHRKADPQNYTLAALDLVLTDLYLAGTDTVSTTLTWGILYLVKYPEIQQRIHDEIISVIGDGPVSLSYQDDLPYTGAALLEVQRMATVTPLMPRQTTKDTTLAGYTLPKGTEVWINFWALHKDGEFWTDPEVFNPNRFLRDDGNIIQQLAHFLPFSAGRRVCMGEQLAKKELFLFFTSIVQQVKFSLPVGHGPPSLEALVDLVRHPRPFLVQVSSWID